MKDNPTNYKRKTIKAGNIYQKIKKSKKKYEKLPPKDVTMVQWETIFIDLIGPCTVTDRLGNGRNLNE